MQHPTHFLKNSMDRDRFKVPPQMPPIFDTRVPPPPYNSFFGGSSFDTSGYHQRYPLPENVCFRCKVNKTDSDIPTEKCAHGKICPPCLATFGPCSACIRNEQPPPDDWYSRRYPDTEFTPAEYMDQGNRIVDDSLPDTLSSEESISNPTESIACVENDMGLKIEYNLNDLHYVYKKLFTLNEADHYYFMLTKEIEYIPEDQVILTLGSKQVKVPRRLSAYGDDGLIYKFNNYKAKAKPWTPTLMELKRRVEDELDYKFNFALVNYYRSGSDSISPHRDAEPDLVPRSPICGLSFGGARKMTFSRVGHSSKHVVLENGSMIVMKYPTNSIWKHGISKCKIAEPRISITFRNLVTKK